MKVLRQVLGLLLLTSAWLPATEEIVIGKFDAKIVPEQATTLSFPTKGMVSDLMVNTEQRVEKGTVIAVLNKEKTEEEREDMELQIQRERLSKKDEIRKLELQREKLRFYLSLTPSERAYAKDYRPEEGDAAATQDALQDIDERISLNERELSTMERRKRKEFNDKHDELTLHMPFTGRIQYHFTMPEDPTQPFEYVQNPSYPFATICDDSSFYITVSITDTNLSLLPPENFSAAVELPGAKKLCGTYAFRRVERSGSTGDMLVFFFKIPEQEHATAYKILGSRMEAVVSYNADKGSMRVSKADLLRHPAASDCEDWQQLVSLLYPDYVILLIAERDILLSPKSTTSDNMP